MLSSGVFYKARQNMTEPIHGTKTDLPYREVLGEELVRTKSCENLLLLSLKGYIHCLQNKKKTCCRIRIALRQIIE